MNKSMPLSEWLADRTCHMNDGLLFVEVEEKDIGGLFVVPADLVATIGKLREEKQKILKSLGVDTDAVD
jgi:hypothetical protein